MGRDRLSELKREAAAADEEDVGDVEADIQEASGEQFMDNFFKKIKTVRESIDLVEKKIDQVEHKHSDLLVAVSKAQQKEINDSLTSLTDEISTIANRIRRDLKTIDEENKKEEQLSKVQDGISADVRIRKSQHATMARKFLAVMSKFSEIQAANKMKQREMVKRQCKIVDPGISDDAVDNVVENGVESIFSGKRLAEAEAALSEIQDRHNDILKLEKSLVELHEMFLDLSILIENQGEMIDRIEFSVDSASQHVEAARVQLKAAKSAQSGARKKQFMILICCLILAGVILAAIIAPLRAVR